LIDKAPHRAILSRLWANCLAWRCTPINRP